MQPIICVVGARPNFMKIAPILRSMNECVPSLSSVLVHTGQHYDHIMSDKLFHDLCLPAPNINLGVGSGTHAIQTAEVMRAFEPVVDQVRPSCVLVVGDVNSTLACSLVAVKKNVPIVHVEAGLRSFDRSMPEEINRILTDQIASRLYTTEETAKKNLINEGISDERICFVGNVMIDTLIWNKKRTLSPKDILINYDSAFLELIDKTGYALITLHRPSNVDDETTMLHLIKILNEASSIIPLIFVIHPRTQGSLERFNLQKRLISERILLVPSQGYLEMLGLISNAKLVLTDSGGIQEETTALRIPCLTLRENTERPITVKQGTNIIVGHDAELIRKEVKAIVSGRGKKGKIPKFWDGKASERIVEDLKKWLS